MLQENTMYHLYIISLTPDTLLNLRKNVKEKGLESEKLIVLKTSTKLDFTSSLVKALSDK